MEENKSGYYVNPETITQLNSSSVTFTVKHETEKHAHTVILRVLKVGNLLVLISNLKKMGSSLF